LFCKFKIISSFYHSIEESHSEIVLETETSM